jgi:hypothetical protein
MCRPTKPIIGDAGPQNSPTARDFEIDWQPEASIMRSCSPWTCKWNNFLNLGSMLWEKKNSMRAERSQARFPC